VYKVLGSNQIRQTRVRRLLPPPAPADTLLANAIYALLVSVRESVSLAELTEKLSQNDMYGALDLLDVQTKMEDASQGKGVKAAESSVWEVLQTLYSQGAQGALKSLDRVAVRKGIGTEMAFDLLSPFAIEFLRQYRFGLITSISAGTVEAIRNILLAAFGFGGDPATQARSIRQVIGLTAGQAAAVQNFRAFLESGDPAKMKTTLERALRDKRFDRTILRTIQEQGTLKPEAIDRMVERYAERALNYRAMSIARTETLRASRIGQTEVWRQAVEQGFLNDGLTRQQWMLGPNPCEDCIAIEARNAGGVPLGEMFETDNGPIDGPPVHTHCFCQVSLIFLTAGEATTA
jgi:hypothetical protein